MISNDMIDVILNGIDKKYEEFKKDIRKTLKSKNKDGGIAYSIWQAKIGNKDEMVDYVINMSFMGSYDNE